MKSRLPVFATLLLFPLALRAADAPTQPAASDDATPLGFIRSQTTVVATGGARVARDRMNVADAKYNQLAAYLANLQADSAVLNTAVSAKWGDKIAVKLSHALGSVAAADTDSASVIRTDNQAQVEWKITKTPTYLILVDGHWKFDVDRTCAGMDERTLLLTEDYYRDLAVEVQTLNDDFRSGVITSPDDLLHRAQAAAQKVAASMQPTSK